MDDPADIWTIDGSLNTLSDRPGMDSHCLLYTSDAADES